MATTRMDKIGTIFTRVTGLLKSGAMKPEDRPIWFDIYRVYPPKYEPRIDRQTPDVPLKQILYQEDLIRAQFQKRFGSGMAGMLVDLSNFNAPPTLCQRVVDTAEKLKIDFPELRDASAEELFQRSVKLLEEQGVRFERRRPPAPSPAISEQKQQQISQLSSLRVADMFRDAEGFMEPSVEEEPLDEEDSQWLTMMSESKEPK